MLQKSVSEADSSTTLASASAPSPVMSLKQTLHGKGQIRCQRVLTVVKASMCGILEVFERCVALERLSDVLCALCRQVIGVETAKERRMAYQRLLTSNRNRSRAGMGRAHARGGGVTAHT